MDTEILIQFILEELDWQKKRHEANPNFMPSFKAAFGAAARKVFLPDACYRKSWMNAIRREMEQKGLLPKQRKEKKKFQTANSGGTWHDRYDHY